MAFRRFTSSRASRRVALIGLLGLVASQIYLISLAPISSVVQDSQDVGVAGTQTGAQRTAPSESQSSPPHIHAATQAAGPSALRFNGTDNYVDVADAPSLHLSTPMTIEAWVKPTAMFSGERHAAGKATYELGIAPLDSGFRVRFKFQIGGVMHTLDSGQYPLNAWYHIAADYDGSNVRLFVNGMRVATATVSGVIDQTPASFRIGSAHDGSSDIFPGLIDEVRLSDSVRYIGPQGFIIPRNPWTPDVHTRGLWHLNEDSGAVADDVSANDNTGILVNDPAWVTDSPFDGPDTIPPAIAAINVDQLTTTHVTVTWTTDEPATSQIFYGTTSAYGDSTPLDSALVTGHSQTITGLSADTHYDFQIASKDAAGNLTTAANATFATPATDPPPSPIVSSMGSSAISQSAAMISWTTNLPADSQVEFGTTTDYGSSTAVDSSLTKTHILPISGLTENTVYHYRVVSRGPDGSSSRSGDGVFVTGGTDSASVGQWSPLMNWPLVAVHSALLPTGNVLTWDAWETNGTASARVWNPTSQTFVGASNQFSSMFCSGHAMLPDGRQIVVGGFVSDETGIKDTNIFNPQTGTWTRVADMNYARWYPTATTLPDGRVLVLGGAISPGVIADIPEIYDPATNIWTALPTARLNVDEYPDAFVMPDGRVFVVTAADHRSYILDVNAKTWTVVGPAIAYSNATMYRPGQIVATGSDSGMNNLTSVIDLNQPTPTWQQTASMAYARFQQTAVQLPDGKVFIVGGADTYSLSSKTGILPTEMWDPTTQTWTTMASLQNLRMYHSTALLLPDGRVLSAGGGRLYPAPDMLTAEIYSPPYLFQGPRPTITGAPATTAYGAAMTVQTPDAANITGVSFVRLGSDTHTFNMDQRYLNLSFTKNGTTLTVQAPANTNLAPPGYYMLFILNGSGVPSVANIVQISGTSQSDTTAPTVSLTAPTSGQTVSGSTVTVSANANDNVGVSSVQFTLDGNTLGNPVTTAPYSLIWDTTQATNGSHTLGAQAKDAAGNTGTATSVLVTVSNAGGGTPPAISTVTASNVQSTTATITWTTDIPATSQVDYGATTSYGSSTTVDSTLVTSHSVPLSGLSPSTTYHYRVRSTNASGNTTISGDFTMTTTAPGPTLLVGDATIEAQHDSNPAGLAAAFQYTAGTSGSVDTLAVYIDSGNTATQVNVGLYMNTRDDNPGDLLTQATIVNPTSGAWNTIAVPLANVTAGTKYWIAVLGPLGNGTMQFRDTAVGGKTQTSAQTNLSVLPSAWTTGTSANTSPLSAYALQSNGTPPPPDTTAPTVSMTAPASGATVSGTAVTISASATDNVGVVSVQFLLDGQPFGAAVTAAPYSVTWDTTTATDGSHMLSAQAKDAAGNAGVATTISVTVANSTPTPTPTSIPTATSTPSGATVVMGSTTRTNLQDYVLAGTANAFSATATTSSTITALNIYLDSTNTATKVVLGIYGNTSGAPGTLLTQGTITAPVNGAWNRVTVPNLAVTAGTTYWFVILAPLGSGTIQMWDTNAGGTAIVSFQVNLTTLPTTWKSGQFYPGSPASMYAESSGGTPVPTATPTSTPTTAASTPTNTPGPTATGTPTPTNTPVPTATRTPTPTNTPGPTATRTPTPTNTPVPTATSTPSGSTALVGSTTLTNLQDYVLAGTANAFSATATSSGTIKALNIYLDSTNTATKVILGVYSNKSGAPGSLLTQGTITAPVNGAWNRVTVPNLAVTAGTTYWFVILAPLGSGTIQMWDTNAGGTAIVSNQVNLKTLPTTWKSGQFYPGSPASIYASSG